MDYQPTTQIIYPASPHRGCSRRDEPGCNSDAASERYQHNFDLGAADAEKREWNCCGIKSPDCYKFCAYYAGFTAFLGQQLRDSHLKACQSNLATLDSEYSDCYEF